MLKKLKLQLVLVAMFSLLLSGQAMAERMAENFFVTPKIGTLGLGLDAGYHFNKMFTLRGNINYMDLDKDNLVKVDDFDYNAGIENFTFGVLLDWHPFAGNFRVSGGLYYRDLDVSLKAKAKGNKTYEIGDYTFNAGELGEVKGKAEWDKFAPYLGIGYGSTASEDSGFSFDFDLGLMYMSGVDINYKVYTNQALAQWEAEGKKHIDKEIKKIENDVDDFKVYPVVSVGFTYRF